MAETTVPFTTKPGVTLYTGGAAHPWSPGSTVSLPQSHADALEKSGHGARADAPAKQASK